VYKECPQLLNRIKSYSSDRKSYGKWTVSSRQTIDLLSSPVNSLLRIGEHEEALKLVMEAKSPNDILNSPAVRRAKAKVNDDIKKIISNINHVEFQNLVVVPYYSDYKMSGYVSATLGDTFDGKTILAFNIKDGRGSIRGKLCHYWRDRFKDEKGFDYVNINGHPKACGCSIKVNAETFIEDLTKLLN